MEGHAPLYEDQPEVVALRATAAVGSDEGVCVLATSTTDLASYERFRPHLDALVRRVQVGT